MRFVIPTLIFAFVIGSFTQLTAQDNSLAKPVMTFDKKMHDFGKVKRGEIKETVFVFTNTGNAPLEIDLVSACDCTTTDYPIRAIAPGQKGEIKVTFDSTEKEESEVIDVDIFLKNEDPATGAPIIEMVQYKFELVQ